MTDEIVTPETPAAPSWLIDDGIPGIGDRPEWLHPRFKSAAELGKSYTELEKKFSNPPDEYDFSKSKYLDPDYAPFEDLKKVAKDKRVPQEVIDKMIESVDKYMDEFSTDPNEEIAKLGENAKERLETLDNWVRANYSKETYEALTSNLRNADAIKALEEMRGKAMSNTPQVPNGNTGAAHNAASLDDLKMELTNNLEKYKTDANYQKDLRSRLEVAVKNSAGHGYVDKLGA